MGTIEISIEEYKKLVEMQVRVDVFADHVKRSDFSIGRDVCASFLDFELDGCEDA